MGGLGDRQHDVVGRGVGHLGEAKEPMPAQGVILGPVPTPSPNSSTASSTRKLSMADSIWRKFDLFGLFYA